tara:strand:- start:180 stop:443 length:264 start_codon:yes stop_codon:yes gene_type:complete
MSLLLNFLKKNNIKMDDIERIFVNSGPGKFSSIRISISIAKAISLSKNINLYGFNSTSKIEGDYRKLLNLSEKELQINELIKPCYSS